MIPDSKPGKLALSDLYSLEKYASIRNEFRLEAARHKRRRTLELDDNATLFFEDRVTMQYQIQEMLRIERIFEQDGIRDELDAYNPLIPDGSNWKATFMLQFPDVDERRRRLAELVGVEDRVWVRVADHRPVFAIADEDMDRSNETKTSSVHFLRFELRADDRRALADGAALAAGIDHSACRVERDPVPEALRAELLRDLGQEPSQ